MSDKLREAAEMVDRAHASFLSSLPYQPREAVYDMYREKLRGPLNNLHNVLRETSE